VVYRRRCFRAYNAAAVGPHGPSACDIRAYNTAAVDPTAQVPVPSAPVEQKRAGGTSPVVLVGLGAAALVALCVIGFLAAAALGVFKTGAKTTIQPTAAASPTTGVAMLAAPT